MKAFYSLIWSGLSSRNRWRFGVDGINPYHVITNRVPRNLPEGFWRSIKGLKTVLRVTTVLLSLCALVCFGGLFFPGTVSIHALQRYSLSCLALIIVLHGCAGMFGLRVAHGRFERFLIKHSWFVCIRCGYALEGLPPHHRCPECGLPYDRGKLQEAWKSWIERNIVYSVNERPTRSGREDDQSAQERRETGDSQRTPG